MKEGGMNAVAPFLWLHNEDDALIVRELERIHACGIRAVCIESRTHEEFCREDWWSDVRLILDECKRLGMKLWILDDKHFPSGYANGIFATKYKHLQPRNIRQRRVDISGPIRSCCILADEWKELPDDELVAAVALRYGEDGQFDGTAIDVSDSYRNGLYCFDLPSGVWGLVILISTQADIQPRHREFCDKLNSDATDAYIEEVYQSHFEHFPNDFGDTLLGFFADEPAFHCNRCQRTDVGDKWAGYPWHKNVYDALVGLWGKDTYTMLCRLWYDFSDGTSASVRVAYMDAITALYRDNFSRRIGNWCHEHGVMYIGHVIEDANMHRRLGSGCGHFFRALDGQHMAGVDVVLHQIVPGLGGIANTGFVSYMEMDHRLNQYVLAKLGTSAAHIDPKKKGRTMCEIFGAYGWAEDLSVMKYLADHFLVRGVNYFVPHAFSPKENDTDCPPNFYNSGKNPQFKYFGKLMAHLCRTSALISGGIHVPVCAVLYDAEAHWASAASCDDRDICKELYDAQLDYDIIPGDCLRDMDKDGVISGEQYPVLLVPYSTYLSKQQADLLARHADRVVIVGDRGYDGYPHVSLGELVAYMEPYRDVRVIGGGKGVRYYHYEKDGNACYLFSNEDITKTLHTTVTLGGFTGGAYTLYDPFENRAVTRFSENGEIPLTLAPYNMVAILPNETVGDEDSFLWENTADSTPISPVWDIALCREQELPHYRHFKTTADLQNVTAPDVEPTFTGNIRYTATVSLSRAEHGILDLGEVGSTAEVRVNGTVVGVRTHPPYRFDIRDAARDGDNLLEITVTNTCVFEQHDRFSKFLPIRPSGLLGPVSVKKFSKM
jgi:hypothetical protein